jgi:hypothetical protein
MKAGVPFMLPLSTVFVADLLLGLSVQGLPGQGITKDDPLIKNEAGTAADGSPTQTVTTTNATFGNQGSTAMVTLTMTTSIMAGGKWTTEADTVNLTMNACPDASGAAPGTLDLIIDGAVGSGSTATSTYHGEISDTFTYLVDDSAQIASEADTSKVTYRAMGARDADGVEHATITAPAGSAASTSTAAFDEDDGSAETHMVLNACLFVFGQMTSALVRDGAKSQWRGGTCVGIRTQPMADEKGKINMTVDPNAQIPITGQPYQKFEMVDLTAPVVGALAGLQSLSQAGQPVPPPASFSYVAGPNFMDQGVVTLKSTSKRGIGTQAATFTVKCDDTKVCPGVETLNTQTCKCECPPPAPTTCPGGQTLDPQTCQCACKLTCPAGQTLNTSVCACETSCTVDPTTGGWPSDCAWIGTVHVTASESFQSDDTQSPIIQNHYTLSMSADASISVATPSSMATGSMTGTVHEVGTEVWPTVPCTMTDTTDATGSHDVVMGSLLMYPMSGGTVALQIDLGTNISVMGTETMMSDCGPVDTPVAPAIVGLTPEYFGETGSLSGSTFSGTDPDAAPMSWWLSDTEHVRYNVTWDMRLVHQ